MNDAVILERSKRLANHAIWTVTLQYRRMRTNEPEDSKFMLRWWADLQFFILSLHRLRTAVKIALNVSDITISTRMAVAIEEFDKAIPDLKKLRDIGEHIDAYAVDNPKRHRPEVNRRQLEVGSWNGTVYEWLGIKLNVDEANTAAQKLFKTLLSAYRNFARPEMK
ncbi:hypothetical protein [Nitrososphaera viennensis]|uniref:HEPN AbiU2-like domain-containing protein n=2 Tax=Nitrososphaera viennensis TaxID=1034015 RepID=A0A060HNX0_9ARCH|nr:hypothetical protein [Nitrososphaera viennensis]AIC17178.1 hypothetical protein NVIE_029020 [Nitrososphaera viennensis EN76]UVS69068.1 hypothetical protein NWT39_14320 [Nitrososphaera viennensis]